jgi:hypothetical protein
LGIQVARPRINPLWKPKPSPILLPTGARQSLFRCMLLGPGPATMEHITVEDKLNRASHHDFICMHHTHIMDGKASFQISRFEHFEAKRW